MPMDIGFWLVALAAAFVIGMSKSGLISALGMAAVPVMTLVMPPREAAGMVLPVLLAMDAIAIWSYRRDINMETLKNMLPGAFLGILIGWSVSHIVSDAAVMLVLGAITLLFVADAILPLRKKIPDTSHKPVAGILWGSFSGFTSFVSHAGGPPYQIYTLPKKMEPRIYAGTSAWFFGIVNAAKIIPYLFLGQISFSSLQISAALIPVSLLFLLLGIWLTKRVATEIFYRVAYVGIFAIALKLIYDGYTTLF